MKSFFARSMRILAGALIVAAAAADNACAGARPRQTRSGDALIEELGAPNGKGFDDIVVQLAPLVSAKPVKDAPSAERPPAPIAAAEPAAVSAAVPPPSDSATAAPVGPIFLREPLPVIDSGPAEEIVKSAEPDIVAAPSAPAAVATAEAPIETEPEAPEQLPREDAAPLAPEQAIDAEKSEAPAVAEADPAGADPAAEPARPQAEEQPAQEESESPLAVWQALVAALALVGLLASKYIRRAPAPSEVAARKPAPAKTLEVAPAGSARKAPTGRFKALGARIGAARAKIEAIRAKFEVVRAKVAALRGDRKATDRPPAPSAAPNAAPEKPKALEWTKAVTALRQRLGGAKPAAAPAAHEPRRMLSLVGTQPISREADAWASSEEDGPELLEPGDASARAIVMNARRRLRAAQS